jgi:flagellar M-ring protein FliF
VPISQRSNAQILLAQNDLPVGRPVPPGWELFSATELMTNQWLQNVKFMRAIQGEIQKQLNAFDFVNDSYVLIREAKEELFVSEQKPSEAAITLDINRPLTKQEVKAIVSIVDHAGGPNLHPGNITVVSTKGMFYIASTIEFCFPRQFKLEL